MRISAVESTELFAAGPRQIVRVTVESAAGEVEIRISGPGVEGGSRTGPAETGDRTAEVPVSARAAPGERVPITVTASGAEPVEAELVVAEPGWTVWMIPHFHYDPVWWNTQAAYTSTWDHAGEWAQANRSDYQHAGFELIRLHLETARREPEYKFVLAEVDYLKPYWDACPQDRAYLRRLMAEGRLEIMGGTYNEPNTNLTGAESTIRNIVHGIGFQRDVLGGDPHTAWQLDAFGHDPQFPGLVADAGLSSSSWARGPFHQWGPMLTGGAWKDPTIMQFPSEFEWLSPSGKGVLTHYMPGHYSAGWWMDAAASLEDAQSHVYSLFLLLKRVAATRNVLLPVGTDYTPPNKWIMEIQRDWNARYASPRFVTGLPREFFAAVRAESPRMSPQTRDMNPIYTGKDVSFIDTKQAQRHAEAQLIDAEKFAVIASLAAAAPYPHAALDKAWRQLVYGAHHDAITGSESDQVYLDLLTGWREAADLGAAVLGTSLRTLSAGLSGVAVWNPSSWPRTDLVRVRLTLPPGSYGVTGADVLLEHPETHPDGSLAEVDAVFVARDVPPMGYRTFALAPSAERSPIGWTSDDGTRIESGGEPAYAVEADPERGGAVASLRVDGRELLQPGRVGNELLVYDEYPAHPDFGEGPWHLVPSGEVVGSAAGWASVRRAECPIGWRLTITGRVGPVAYTQEITLWDGLPRVDLVTYVDEFDGADKLLRLRWPIAIPGALPVSEVGDAVIGRGYGLIDVDSGDHPWTLDNPANHWFALSSTARVTVRTPEGAHLGTRALGIAEIITPPAAGDDVRRLAVALVRQGVTATCSVAPGARYGNLAVDSNLPDFRIAVGSPEENPFVAGLLDEGETARLRDQLAARGRARIWIPADEPLEKTWVPSADLTAPRALPVLVVCGEGSVDELVEDLADAVIEVVQADAELTDPDLDDYTVGLVNRGVPGFAVDASGAMHVSLMRSCTAWPSGIWIDPPRRTAPDGSNFQLQHWTHSFECALVAAPGDWRAADLVRHGHDVNHPLLPVATGRTGSPDARSFLATAPGVILSAMKARGNPLASGREPGPLEGVTIRLCEAHGRTPSAEITTSLPLGEWHRADLLENTLGPAPDTLTGMEIATLTSDARSSAPRPAPRPAPCPAAEPFQPVYTRYWLNNTGPAPMGGLPVAVHISPGDVDVTGPVELTLSVASSRTEGDASGLVTLVPPDGWTVTPAARPYALPPGACSQIPVRLTPPPGAPPGLYLLRVTTGYDGQTYEDVTRLHVGGRQDPGLEVTAGPDAVRLPPGGSGEITVRLRSAALSAVPVQAQLIAPWPCFDLFPGWNTGVLVDGEAEIRFAVQVPKGARPGRWWAVVKLASAGWLHYTQAIEIEIHE